MSAPDLAAVSCLLFVPGHRPDRFGRARAACPEGIVVDLEDAVPPEGKEAARAHALDFLRDRGPGAPVMVRINALGTTAALDDLAALARGGALPDALVLSKVEAGRDIEIVRACLPAALPILAAVETARALGRAHAIAATMRPGDALGFGGADLAADLGADLAWEPMLTARATLVAAAAAAGCGILDVPWLALDDAAGLAAEAARVRALGFTGKLAIHPAQVAPIRAAFAPDAAAVDNARRIVAALAAAAGGVARLDGRMIDAPVARTARRVLARAAVADGRGPSGTGQTGSA